MHTGLTAELMQKYILKAQAAVNSFIAKNRYISHMGKVGEWKDDDVRALVLPVAGAMDEDELDMEEGVPDDFMNEELLES